MKSTPQRTDRINGSTDSSQKSTLRIIPPSWTDSKRKRAFWHVFFWIVFFSYNCYTDWVLYETYSLPKELILVCTHNIFLFYSLLFCFRRFSATTVSRLFLSLGLFLTVVAVFFGIRFSLNYFVYPVIDAMTGFEKEKLDAKILFISGTLWVVQYFFISSGYYYLTRSIQKEKELRIAQLENLEQEKREHEAKLNEERANAYVNLVHETQTPLTLITNYLEEYLSKNNETPELTVLKNGIFKLSRDMGNLFNLERFLRGFDVYKHNQTCNFSKLLNESLALFEPYCQNKGIELIKVIEPDIVIAADPNAINSIINNLIGNAIKFAPCGRIEVILRAADGWVNFTVKDEGPGISPDLHDKIFQPYFQLNSQNNTGQGMGLGLSLLMKTVLGMGGSIMLESDPKQKKGTCFNVRLMEYTADSGLLPSVDLEKSNYEAYTLPQMEIVDSAMIPDRKAIMIVEDNQAMLSYLYQKLVERYNVIVARNGKEALKRLLDEGIVPDLILSDVMMDEMDGFEMVKALHKMPTLQHLPVVFLTARSLERDKVRGFESGAVGYIEKPFTMEMVFKKIESILDYTAAQRAKLYQDAYALMGTLSGNSRRQDNKLPMESFHTICERFSLTQAERDIIQLLMAGAPPKSIAESTHRSIKTVETHVTNIYKKVGVSSRTELIRIFQ